MGKQPKQIDQELLNKLQQFILQPTEYGVPGEVEYGWCGGRHILDSKFSFEHNVFVDALHFALRIDSNRVPSELKRAYKLMEEEATAQQNPSGFVSKKQKQNVRESVRRKMHSDLKDGKFRRSKMVHILWDFPSRIIYASMTSSAQEKLLDLFGRTFGLELQPLTAGTLALRELESKGKRRDYEDARPTRVVHGPDGEGQHPEYPWVAKGPQPKDFLGNEFLLWLWHETELHGGGVKTEVGELSLLFDRMLDVDCAYGQTGRDTLRGDGPTHMPEARDALRSGKLPRKAGLIIETAGKQFEFTFNCELFACTAAKLPEVEDADDARVVFEERIAMLRELSSAVDGLFSAFLKLRASSSWEGQTSSLRRWIQQLPKHAAVA